MDTLDKNGNIVKEDEGENVLKAEYFPDVAGLGGVSKGKCERAVELETTKINPPESIQLGVDNTVTQNAGNQFEDPNKKTFDRTKDATKLKVAYIFAVLAIPIIILFAVATFLATISASKAPVVSGIVTLFLCLLPLVWNIPMTRKISKIKKGEKPLSTGFSICSLLFQNLITGILLLCCQKDK